MRLGAKTTDLGQDAKAKRTYSLPTDVLRTFEKEIVPSKRSRVISGLLRDWLQRRQKVIEGCAEMAEVYLEIETEFHPLEEETERLMRSGTNRKTKSRGKRS